MSSWDEANIFGNTEEKIDEKKINKPVDSINIFPNNDVIKVKINEEKTIIAQVKYKDQSTSNNIEWHGLENDVFTFNFIDGNKLKFKAKELGIFEISIVSKEDISKYKIIKINVDENYSINTFDNGDKYVGSLKDSKPHGQGILTSANGDKYVGTFKDGEPHGQFTLTSANGDKCVGTFEYFKDGEPHGQGILTSANGDKYVGTFKGLEPHGHGTLTYANGDKYVGTFKDGEPHGHSPLNVKQVIIYQEDRTS